MPAKFARYIFHILPILSAEGATQHPDLDRVLLWDEGLNALAQRRLPTLMLSDHWQAVDGYLRLRAEQFETLAEMLVQRQAWVGSWYWSPQPTDSAEMLIRNLLLGRRSASAFGLVEAVGLAGLPAHDSLLPSLAVGFGFRTVYRLHDGVSATVIGADGLPMNCISACADPIQWRATQAADSQHVVIAALGRPREILQQIQDWRLALPHDDLFLTNPTSLGAIQPNQMINPAQVTQWGDYWGVEADYARSAADGQPASTPFLALQQAYYDPVMREALGRLLHVEQHDLIEASAHFHIMAIKPREDGAGGVIVRGVNIGSERLEVTLRLWRRFEHCEIVRLDERPSGGSLSIEADGAIRFMAAPSRLLTFWLY